MAENGTERKERNRIIVNFCRNLPIYFRLFLDESRLILKELNYNFFANFLVILLYFHPTADYVQWDELKQA